MIVDLSDRLVPDDLWALIDQLLPTPPLRPQGGGMARVDSRQLLVAMVFCVTSGSAWRTISPIFGVAMATLYRRFREWTEAGVWEKLLVSAEGSGNKDWICAVAHAMLARDQVGRRPKKVSFYEEQVGIQST
jgi:transposase